MANDRRGRPRHHVESAHGRRSGTGLLACLGLFQQPNTKRTASDSRRRRMKGAGFRAMTFRIPARLSRLTPTPSRSPVMPTAMRLATQYVGPDYTPWTPPFPNRSSCRTGKLTISCSGWKLSMPSTRRNSPVPALVWEPALLALSPARRRPMATVFAGRFEI